VPSKAIPSGIPTPSPTLRASLLLLPGGTDDAGVAEVEVDETVESELVEVLGVVVALEVAEVEDVEELVGLGPIVVKGNKPPISSKVPFPVWQLHLEVGSLSQQNVVLVQLTTPASESVL
jgi:hypothetical protein